MIEDCFPRCRQTLEVNNQMSAEINSHIDAFLEAGGVITQVPSYARADFDVESVPSGSIIRTHTCKHCKSEFRAPKRLGAPRKYCKKSCRLAARVK